MTALDDVRRTRVDSSDPLVVEIAGGRVITEFLDLCALLRKDPSDLATALAEEVIARHHLDVGAPTVVVHRRGPGGRSTSWEGDMGDLEIWKLAFPGVASAEDLGGLPGRRSAHR